MRTPTYKVGLALIALGMTALAPAGMATAVSLAEPHQPAETEIPYSYTNIGGVSVSIASAADTVPYGSSVRISGKLSPGVGGERLFLERNSRGSWARVASVTTDEEGNYGVKVRLRRSTRLRVRSESFGIAADRTVNVLASVKRIRKALSAWVGRRVHVSGRVRPATEGRRISLDMKRDDRWVKVDGGRTGKNGRFKLSWVAQKQGSERLRLRVKGDENAVGFSKALRVSVFAPANASYFGPGFFGSRTACGKTMTRESVLVAHRTLACGTKIKFYYRGRVVTAKVQDRGPFHSDRIFDLSQGLKDRLGFGSTGTVGYMVL